MNAQDTGNMCRRLRELSGGACEEAWSWFACAHPGRGSIRFTQTYPASNSVRVYVCAHPAPSLDSLVFDDVYLEVDYDESPDDDQFQEFLAALRRAQDLATLIRRVFAPAKPTED